MLSFHATRPVSSSALYNTPKPSIREHQRARLQTTSPQKPFDVLIIGGGSSGTGAALDAQTRKLNTALIEREDFASGTSSKSTKLVHGGVRYLEKAVLQLDIDQFKLVYEALQERDRLLANAPYLAGQLPIITPCFDWWDVIYYGAGLKVYDILAGSRALAPSRYLNVDETRSLLPTLTPQKRNKTLKGSILYYDGQFDDACLNVALATTAAAAGACVSNYIECVDLIKDARGKVAGAFLFDRLDANKTVFPVYAKAVVNATGVFTDEIRKKTDRKKKNSVFASAGTHITLPASYGSDTNGMIVPKTADGRVLFMLPFQDRVIAGTTDQKTAITDRPRAQKQDVRFILETLQDYLQVSVSERDVLSAWCGLRPLPDKGDASKGKGTGGSQNVVRDHVIFRDADGIINATGGKWTTYRSMAEQLIDTVIAHEPTFSACLPCQTRDLKLVVPQVAHETGLGDTLKAEVVYACRYAFCMTVRDFIARRSRMAFLDVRACEEAIPRIALLMAEIYTSWDDSIIAQEIDAAYDFLYTQFTPTAK